MQYYESEINGIFSPLTAIDCWNQDNSPSKVDMDIRASLKHLITPIMCLTSNLLSTV
jgi:hypothetical protein